jgi:hypothetical protein
VFQPVDVDDLKEKFKHLSIIHLAIDTEQEALPGWKIRKIEKR